MMFSRTLLALTFALSADAVPPACPVVDTGQVLCYDEIEAIRPPRPGNTWFGQDAQYRGVAPSYTDHGDGTVTDNVTGLMWSRDCPARKLGLAEARASAETLTLAGYDDWRLPTIRELYSLIDFRGVTGLMGRAMDSVPTSAVPYINTDYFEFRYGDTARGERFIDAQWVSSTENVSPIMAGEPGVFGVNFADGRIKCYPVADPRRGGPKTFYVRYVRGRADYDSHDYVDQGDGTVTDRATGLTWARADSGRGMNWAEALAYAEDATLAGHDDWRLPNAKELQSIVDYTRSPEATDSPAIDPVLACTGITNEAGQRDYPFYWTSTTHVDGPNAGQAVYVAFGRGIGEMRGRVLDVHGAGCQRSDPKEGEASLGNGPQGDARRVDNYVRLVRAGAVLENAAPDAAPTDAYPNRVHLADRDYTPAAMEYREPPAHPPVGRESGGPGEGRPFPPPRF